MNNILEVKYRGFPGYGDIVSPICYTHNICSYFNVDTRLNYYYYADNHSRYRHPESEDTKYIVQYIFDNTDKKNISSTLILNQETVSNNVKKHNMIEKIPYHNYAVANDTLRWIGGGKYVALITTRNNLVPFDQYPTDSKLWKDPLSTKDWEEIYFNFPDARFVDYLTPLEEAIDILKHAELVISYHGSAAWLARWLACPQLIFSGKPKLTAFSFPNAIVRTGLDTQIFEASYVEHCQNVGHDRTVKARSERELFICAG